MLRARSARFPPRLSTARESLVNDRPNLPCFTCHADEERERETHAKGETAATTDSRMPEDATPASSSRRCAPTRMPYVYFVHNLHMYTRALARARTNTRTRTVCPQCAGAGAGACACACACACDMPQCVCVRAPPPPPPSPYKFGREVAAVVVCWLSQTTIPHLRSQPRRANPSFGERKKTGSSERTNSMST